MNIFYIVLGLIILIYMINIVIKGRFSIVESFFWVCGAIAILILSIFPKLIIILANLIGIEYAPSLLFMLCSIYLLFISFRCSRRICEQQEKIIDLAQRIAILEEKINRK